MDNQIEWWNCKHEDGVAVREVQVRLDTEAIKAAFQESALAASTLLRAVVESPSIAKSETAPGEMAAGLAEILVQKIAEHAIRPLYDVEKAQQARRERLEKWEAKQAAIAAQHAGCDEAPCEECVIAKDEDEMYAKALVDNSRPHLDSERAERDGRIASVPWREEEEPDDEPVEQTPIRRAAMEIGFGPGDTDDALVHSSLGHVLKMADDGSFWITSGWDHETTYKGTTPNDLVEAMEVLDQ